MGWEVDESRAELTDAEVVKRVEYVESHMDFDADEDGWAEPVIITWRKDDSKAVCVRKRYDDSATLGDGGRPIGKDFFRLALIVPAVGDKKFPVGLPELLDDMTRTTSTLANMTLDSGRLANGVGGFMSSSVGIGAGKYRYKPAEWRMTSASPEALTKSFFPIPFNPLPAQVGALLEKSEVWGRELASVSTMTPDTFPSGMSGATALALVESGMSGFKAMYKRLARVIGQAVNDFAHEVLGVESDMTLVNDEMYSSAVERGQKADFYMSLVASQNPAINQRAATRAALEAMGEENPDRLLIKEPKPPASLTPNPLVMAQIALIQAQTREVEARAAKVASEVGAGMTDAETRRMNAHTEGQKRMAQAVDTLSIAEERLITNDDNEQYIKQLQQLKSMGGLDGESIGGAGAHDTGGVLGGAGQGGGAGVPGGDSRGPGASKGVGAPAGMA
ncbi:hypothetical protein FACS1894186_4790 [Alphaproteobacteria bacterium]|nr:hypothetical protein FACS1894186_4790 [Alphaproteobacteria bacterium]